jgi:uncharacterized protein
MTELVTYFVGGLLGSAHCVGMCGGFALAIGATKPSLRSTLADQGVYSLGRICTYSFLGALAGAVGMYLGHVKGSLVVVQQVLSVVAGVIMLVIGFGVLFGVGLESLTSSRLPFARWTAALFAPVFKMFLNARGRWNFLLAGVFTGFLPCGLVYAFLALAMAEGDLVSSMSLMAAFGLGTCPAMIALGCGGSLTSRVIRARVHRVAACFVVLLGFATIARGLPFVPCHWLPIGEHTTPNACQCDH